MEVVYKLWEGSWEDDAVVRDKKNRIFTDPSKVHDINHEGKYYKVPGAHLGEPSPQRTPFLFQAGTSKKGMEFAGKHAEAVFVIGTSPEELRPTVDKLRQQAAAAGRDPRSVKIIVMLTPITAPTDEEAQAKLEDFNQYIDMDAALTLFGGWTGIDMSSAPADQPLESMESDAIRAMIEMLTGVDSEVVWTKERLAKWLCIGGFSASVVGSPKTIVDEMERWMEIADVDGFNLGRVIAPGSMRDFVELVVPELRKRGHVPQEPLAPMTLRERLTGDSRLPSEHAGANYRLGAGASVS
jgi:FMN-dependent oxidoreductase (nitrilotriacetate monooxygenase family)